MKFIDYHAHIYGTGYKVIYPRLDGLQLNDIVTVVRSAAEQETVVDDGYLLLRGWDQNIWDDPRYPTREMLDDILPDLPAALIRIDGHTLWCNSAMLRFAGISRSTPIPDGGEILTSFSGEPNGILIDEAMNLVYQKLPPENPDRIRSILRAGLDRFAEHHSAVFDMGIPAQWWQPFLSLYQNDGDALISSYIFLDMTKPSGKRLFLEMVSQQSLPKDLHPKLKFAGIKLYLDGALGSRGAHLFEDYTDDPGNRGLRLMDDNEALMLMGLAAEHHLQIAVHAIGDAANSRALDLYAEIRKRYPQSKSLMRIEHSQIVRSSDIPRYHELDIWAVIQPQFWLSDHQWAVQRLGEDRMQNAYRWRSLLEAGINVAASSDSPVEEADPLLGIAAFRSDRDEAIGTDQAEILYSPNDLLNIIS